MSDTIKQYYVEENNPDGGFFPGVPLRDLTEDEFNDLAPWQQKSIDESRMYRRTKPDSRKAPKSEE